MELYANASHLMSSNLINSGGDGPFCRLGDWSIDNNRDERDSGEGQEWSNVVSCLLEEKKTQHITSPKHNNF